MEAITQALANTERIACRSRYDATSVTRQSAATATNDTGAAAS